MQDDGTGEIDAGIGMMHVAPCNQERTLHGRVRADIYRGFPGGGNYPNVASSFMKLRFAR